MILLQLLLTGCATGGSDQIYVLRCPPLIAYTAEFQGQVATELSAMPPTAATLEMMADYGTLRAKCRALD